MRTEIFGRNKGRTTQYGEKGCGYLGKIVSYPGGRYEEAGRVLVDLADPHCMLVLGKRGTGKSYTLGVLLEGFASLEAKERNNVSILVVDTMSVFHSLKTQNSNTIEKSRMKDFDGVLPTGMDNIRIAVPSLTEKKLEERGSRIHKDIGLTIRPRDVSQHLWLQLFGLKASDPYGSLLLSCIRKMHGDWTLKEMKSVMDDSQVEQDVRRGLLALVDMAESTLLFNKDGQELVAPGYITILDISYLGRIGGLDLRAFIVAHLAETTLKERTLQTTIEMQRQAGFFPNETEGKETVKDPLVWLVIDEAHLFLPSEGNSISSQPLVDWIKLGRHPGLSIIMATQEPSALHDTAIRQADLVLSHQITAEPDIQALGKARQSFMTSDRDLPTMVSNMDGRRGLAIMFDDKTRKMEYCMIRPRMTLHTGMDASLLK